MKRIGIVAAAVFGLAAVLVPTSASAEADVVPSVCDTQASMKSTKVCLPPAEFAKKLCATNYPDMALTMFAKGTPWTRVFLAGDVEAWNASGGFTSRTQLAFDEEVLVLQRHAAATTGGMTLNGGDSNYDVLRWDGSCVSVQEGELTMKRPPQPLPAPMKWSRFEEATKRALLTSKKVKTSKDAVEKACNGDHAACEEAEKAFANTIATSVRTGATLPTPSRRP